MGHDGAGGRSYLRPAVRPLCPRADLRSAGHEGYRLPSVARTALANRDAVPRRQPRAYHGRQQAGLADQSSLFFRGWRTDEQYGRLPTVRPDAGESWRAERQTSVGTEDGGINVIGVRARHVAWPRERPWIRTQRASHQRPY